MRNISIRDHFFDWICEQCSLCYLSDLHLQDQLATDMHSSDPMTAQKSLLLLRTLETLKMDGVVFTKDVMKEYKQILNNLDLPRDRHNQFCNSFRKYLIILSKNHNYKVFIPGTNVDTYGRALYDERKF